MCRSPLKSNKGQIAVFLVLLFQVLFVFFAMSMNIGLVVYDKINLQNAADLSAYYAAQRQAELLNQIAHINYQMRQAYKLLTFRLRVVGSVSIGIGPESQLAPHPIRIGANFDKENVAFFEKPPGRLVPSVCIGSSLWHEYKITEQNSTVSLCATMDQFSAVPPSGGSDPFGFTSGLNVFLDKVRGAIEEKCKVVGVLNWQLAASWLYAYVHEATERRKAIDAIANNMSLSGNEITDFTGQQIFLGARNTFTKNLTEPQRQGLTDFKLINSLSSDVEGNCSEKNFWLAPIDLYPAVSYVSMTWSGFTCTTRAVSSRGNSPPSDYINLVGGRNNGILQGVWNSGSPIPYGVEKNPWCAPYMGVTATTQPRKIFAPFANPPVLKAQAFAKPFGGRIGPWYSSQWTSGNKNSSGTNKVDPLLPARSIDGARAGGELADDIVNHAKYPGDRNGMNSAYALGVMNPFFTSKVGNPMSQTLPSFFALAFYNHIGDPPAFESQKDSLARPNGLSTPNGLDVRAMEEAAIIPDLFDITYYSVEAQYTYNFKHPGNPSFNSFVSPHYPDLGSQNDSPYSVVDQLSKSRQVFTAGYPFYMVSEPDNLLTGWTQEKAVKYGPSPQDFGLCLKRRDGEMETSPGPSGCPHGGRSGYSVKVVSAAYLRNTDADLGNAGAGPILNPPPATASP
jgi:hypothetical protein